MSAKKKTPCQSPDSNPEDWFIESYGKQYREDKLLTLVEVRDIALPLLKDGKDREEVQKVVDLAASENKRKALVRRRVAKDRCREECPIRNACLRLGLEEENLEFGIFGGYYPEERRAVVRLRDGVDEA